MKYHFKVHKEGNGYWAECIELEGCLTQTERDPKGGSIEELHYNMREALNLYLSESPDSDLIFPRPLQCPARPHVDTA